MSAWHTLWWAVSLAVFMVSSAISAEALKDRPIIGPDWRAGLIAASVAVPAGVALVALSLTAR